jgi:hypothetical protein
MLMYLNKVIIILRKRDNVSGIANTLVIWPWYMVMGQGILVIDELQLMCGQSTKLSLWSKSHFTLILVLFSLGFTHPSTMADTDL